METIEYNKMIAEFMGYEINEDGSFLMGCKLPQFRGSDHNEWCSATKLNLDFSKKEDCEKAIKIGEFYWNISPNNIRYHNSWDWLMPVVEMIEGLTDGIYQVDILQEGCQIKCRCKYFIDKTVGKLPIGTTKIEAVWLAVIDFIKWYNNKPKE